MKKYKVRYYYYTNSFKNKHIMASNLIINPNENPFNYINYLKENDPKHKNQYELIDVKFLYYVSKNSMSKYDIFIFLRYKGIKNIKKYYTMQSYSYTFTYNNINYDFKHYYIYNGLLLDYWELNPKNESINNLLDFIKMY